MSFEYLFLRWNWRPIPGCPGRYSLSPDVFSGEPERLLDETCAVREFQSGKAPDPVSVATIDGGGLISYRKPDGRFIHTLNTPEGLKRKLRQLEIELGPALQSCLSQVEPLVRRLY